MNIQRFAPPTVMGLGGVLAAAVLFNFAFGDEPDYADLVPPPNEIVLREDAEQIVWLSTNRHDVEMRIDSIDVGLGAIKRLTDSGETIVLGESTGCFETAVKTILVENTSETATRWTFTIDTGDLIPLTTFRLYYRLFEDGVRITNISALLDVASSDETTWSRTWSGLRAGSKYRLEGSTDSHFPYTTTDYVEWTQVENGADVMSDAFAEHIDLLEDTGVELIGCHEHEDILITLHGDDGEELNRYQMDVLQAATPVPTPEPTATPVPAPVFDPVNPKLRFCADAASPRRAILDGSETVSTTTLATGMSTTTYALAPSGDSTDFALFDINSTSSAITVSDIGADDHTGIDGTRIYTFKVIATDAAGRRSESLVAVQLDLTNLADLDDGVCP